MKYLVLLFIILQVMYAKNSSQVTYIKITDSTINKAKQYPLPRAYYGKLINYLFDNYKPNTLAISILFMKQKETISKDNLAFVNAIKKRKIVFTGYISKNKVNHQEFKALHINTSKKKLHRFKGLDLPMKALLKEGATFGVSAIMGTHERKIIMPIIANIEGYIYPSLVLKTVMLYKNFSNKSIKQDGIDFILNNKKIENIRACMYGYKEYLKFNTYTATELFEGSIPPEHINNKVIVVGIDYSKEKSIRKFGELMAIAIQDIINSLEKQ